MAEKEKANALYEALAECYDDQLLIYARENNVPYSAVTRERRKATLMDITNDIEAYVRFLCDRDLLPESQRRKLDEEVEMV